MAKTTVHYTPAQLVTAKASAAVGAGLFVEIAGAVDGRNPVIKPATAGATPFGVVAHDVEQGGYVTVLRAGHFVDVQGSGINAGDLVEAGASGKAAKSAGTAPVVGIALTGVVDGHVQVALV